MYNVSEYWKQNPNLDNFKLQINFQFWIQENSTVNYSFNYSKWWLQTRLIETDFNFEKSLLGKQTMNKYGDIPHIVSVDHVQKIWENLIKFSPSSSKFHLEQYEILDLRYFLRP